MAIALQVAKRASMHGDVPIGAVVLDAHGELCAQGGNEKELTGDPTAHAELLALRQAAVALGGWRLSGCTLVTTLEPCTMCAGAAVQARISRLVIGAWDEKAGAVSSLWDVVRDPRLNHRIEVISQVKAEMCTKLLQDYFASQRA